VFGGEFVEQHPAVVPNGPGSPAPVVENVGDHSATAGLPQGAFSLVIDVLVPTTTHLLVVWADRLRTRRSQGRGGWTGLD
jgi:hypothetical protein